MNKQNLRATDTYVRSDGGLLSSHIHICIHVYSVMHERMKCDWLYSVEQDANRAKSADMDERRSTRRYVSKIDEAASL